MSNDRVLQARIDQYAYGVWFETVDINPYEQTVTVYDHIFEKEITFSDVDKSIQYREVGVYK
ncbi:hypothetical protein [Jeotgalibaca porci]|jgi:hypothetical protein|uniref:hypothetical protein n=1 Tax=Jeotgalibaca porci TaxID=1868793 RepID=UPI00359FBC87